jgi:hypothetical protein
MSNINTISRQPFSPEQDGKFIFTQGHEQFYPQEPNGQRPPELGPTPDPKLEARVHAATARELAIAAETKAPAEVKFDAAQAIETLSITGIRLNRFYRAQELSDAELN